MKIMKWVLLFILIATKVNATNYFFSASGNDAAAGTEGAPWQTIAKANATTFVAGDSIKFNKGDEFVGHLNIIQSGNNSNRIVLTSYGTGAKPILTTRIVLPGSNNTANWINTGTNRWRFSKVSVNNTDYRLWLNGVEYARSYDSSGINSTNRTSNTTNYNYVWVYATSNPATFYSTIEFSSDETSTLEISGSYITVYDLDVRGSTGSSIDFYNCTNLIFRNNNIGWDASKLGIRGFGSAHYIDIYDNDINSGDQNIDAFNTNKGVGDGVYISSGAHYWNVYRNTLHNWGHSSIEIANMQIITGLHLLGGYSLSNISIYENLIRGGQVDYVRGFGADSKEGYNVNNIVFTRNWIDSCPIRSQINIPGLVVSYNIFSNGRVTPSIVGVGQGLYTAGYSGTSPINMQIIGNTFYNFPEAGFYMSWSTGYGTVTGNKIKNNIFSNCGTNPSDVTFANVQVVIQPFNLPANMTANVFKNNILFGTDKIYYDNRTGGGLLNNITQMNSRNTVNGDSISGNINVNPLLTNYVPGTGSPAIGAGLSLPYNIALAAGSLWPSAVLTTTQTVFNIGAYGQSASLSTPPTLTAAVGATVDNSFDVTFADDATWRSNITAITVNGTTIGSGVYNKTVTGKITFIPANSIYLQTPGTKTIIISSSTYKTDTVSQVIGVGAANKLVFNTQPTAPATNGGALAIQPIVKIYDQYNNQTASNATVTATAVQGTWTLGGTTSVAGVNGIVTYSGLTATSTTAITGATINFTSEGLTGIQSSAFNVPSPYIPTVDTSGVINIQIRVKMVEP